jgi:prepilin-type N-terminal cleavage/methylation domain-containing protein
VLMDSMEKKRSGEAGFTLVELIVVIAILAILAGIVVFAVSGVQDKGSDAANKTTCSVLQTAEEAYFANQTPGSYAIGATAQDTLKTAGFLHTKNPAFSITAPVAPDVGYTITGPNGTC